jgi:hypothetical protein
MKIKFRCKIGFHKYEFKEYWPQYLQPWFINPEKHNWKIWIEKCILCDKERSCDDLIK